MSNKKISNKLSRRAWIKQMLTGSSSLLLYRSLATGLPLSFLLDPLNASAQTVLTNAKSLILSASELGCPLNANCPGSYVDPRVKHPNSSRMAPINITLNGSSHQAATPWGQLSQDTLNHTAFIHHPTFTGSHGAFRDVMKLQAKVRNSEMMVSAYAPYLQQAFGTKQAQPIVLSGQRFSYKGAFQPSLRPTAIKDAFLGNSGQLGSLKNLRNSTLDRIHAIYRGSATIEQKKLLDQLALSQDQANTISTTFLNLLNDINNNDPLSQIRTALILTAMKIAPVYTMWLPFGGDNHFDEGYSNEIDDHESGVATLEAGYQLMKQFRDNGSLQNDVLFGWTGVFGRTLFSDKEGRDHNSSHCVTLLMGRSVQGGVVGNTQSDKISSSSGQNDNNGDIDRADMLASMGKTVGACLGMTDTIINEEVTSGKVLSSVVR